MERAGRLSKIREENLTPPSPNRNTPGATSEDSLDIKTALIKQDIIADTLKTLETQKKNLGFFKSAANINDQIKTTHQVAELIQKIETAHAGIPLDNETKKFLLELPENYPDAFGNLQNFLKPLSANEDPKMRYANATAAIFTDTSLQQDHATSDKLKSLYSDVSMTQAPINIQFNKDQLTGANTRRESEINRFQKVLNGNTTHEKGLTGGSYVTDPIVIAAQKQHVDSAKSWGTENGFENTRWFPSGFSGKGMLLCADWDPQEQKEGGPLKVSRHIGIMLGGRVRMTRITTETPGNFSKAEKENMLANFSTIKTPEAEAFMQECDFQITQMHSEIAQKTGLEKMVFKEGAIKQAFQLTNRLKSGLNKITLDEATQKFINDISYLHPGVFKKLVDFANSPDPKLKDLLRQSLPENSPLIADLNNLITQIELTKPTLKQEQAASQIQAIARGRQVRKKTVFATELQAELKTGLQQAGFTSTGIRDALATVGVSTTQLRTILRETYPSDQELLNHINKNKDFREALTKRGIQLISLLNASNRVLPNRKGIRGALRTNGVTDSILREALRTTGLLDEPIWQALEKLGVTEQVLGPAVPPEDADKDGITVLEKTAFDDEEVGTLSKVLSREILDSKFEGSQRRLVASKGEYKFADPDTKALSILTCPADIWVTRIGDTLKIEIIGSKLGSGSFTTAHNASELTVQLTPSKKTPVAKEKVTLKFNRARLNTREIIKTQDAIRQSFINAGLDIKDYNIAFKDSLDRLHDGVTEGNAPKLAGDLLDAIPNLSAVQKIKILSDLAKALRAFHRAGWVHGDVKAENTLVTPLKNHGHLADVDGAVKTGSNWKVSTKEFQDSISRNYQIATPFMDIFALAITAEDCFKGTPPNPYQAEIDAVKKANKETIAYLVKNKNIQDKLFSKDPTQIQEAIEKLNSEFPAFQTLLSKLADQIP